MAEDKLSNGGGRLTQGDICAFLFEDELRLRNARESAFHSGYRFPLHSHTDFELDVVTSGRCAMIVGEKHIPLEKHEGMLVFPNVPHAYEGDEKLGCGMMQLEFSIMQKGRAIRVKCLPETQDGFLVLDCPDIFEKILRNIYSYIDMKLNGAEKLLKYEFLKLFTLIEWREDAKRAEPEVAVPDVLSLRQYLIDHYTEPVKLERLAEAYGVSSRAIRKHFQKHFGASPVQYLTGLRIKRACELLRESDDSITEIALCVGFESSQYFSRTFRAYTDMTPRQYRAVWRALDTNNSKEIIEEAICIDEQT